MYNKYMDSPQMQWYQRALDYYFPETQTGTQDPVESELSQFDIAMGD
jgi:hypothetical protein